MKIRYESATTIVFCLTQPRRYSALEISLIGRDKIVAWILINGTFAMQQMSAKNGSGTRAGKITTESAIFYAGNTKVHCTAFIAIKIT